MTGEERNATVKPERRGTLHSNTPRIQGVCPYGFDIFARVRKIEPPRVRQIHK
jgi:hypothetical protein